MKKGYAFIFGVLGLLLLNSNSLSAQKTLLPFDRVTSHDALRQLFNLDSNIHLSYKPLLIDKSHFDQIIENTNNRYTSRKYENWVGRKLFKENLAVIKAEEFYMTFDVVTNLELGFDLEENVNDQISTNTRGVLVQGNVTDKVYFRTDFYETQSFFPAYVDSMIRSSKVVPGQGKAKSFKTGGFDYPMVTGLVNFQASKNLNVQFGQDKLFIGNGYRSLLLSDNTAPYLFLQAGVSLFENKINYHANWASLQNLTRVHGAQGGDALFAKKQANFNYLSFKPNSKIEIGLFEGVMWERWNSDSHSQDFDPVFINPIPFLTTAIKHQDTLVSSILGLNVFAKPFSNGAFYGQLSYGVKGGGVGFQLGTKWFDIARIKGLNFQVEYNLVGNKIYGTQNDYVDYFQFNQPLTVQQMEDFTEFVFIASYRYNRMLMRFKGVMGHLNKTAISDQLVDNYDVNLAYLLNPITNLMVNAGMRYRYANYEPNTNWVYFGVKTNLRNLYYDF